MTTTTRPPQTERQLSLLLYIRRYISERGYAPSFGDIATEFSMSSRNGARVHVLALKRKGYLAHDPNVARSIREVSHGT
jgi:SOS-response transcriptional repressor LexA